MAQCQCRDCQYATGTGHFSGLAFSTAAVNLTGAPKFFEMEADSGNMVSRGFCPNCGSLVLATTRITDTLIVSAGSLDDPSVFSPACVFFTSRGYDWDKLDPDLPKYSTEAPAGVALRGHNI